MYFSEQLNKPIPPLPSLLQAIPSETHTSLSLSRPISRISLDPTGFSITHTSGAPARLLPCTFKTTILGGHYPSPPRGVNTDPTSYTTRNDSVQEAAMIPSMILNEAEFARSSTSDLDIEETDFNVKPFAFKPLQLASLVGLKSLEKLEHLGGVEGLLRGLGTNPPPSLCTTSRGHKSIHPETPPISLAGILERPRSTASLGDGSGVDHPDSLKFSPGAYEASIKDRQRIYGRNILPQRPSKSLLHLMWLALQDKVIVRSMAPQFSLYLMFAHRRSCCRSPP